VLREFRGWIEFATFAQDRLNVLLLRGYLGLRHESPDGKWSFKRNDFIRWKGLASNRAMNNRTGAGRRWGSRGFCGCA
jgi:hypothetical protein